MNEGNLMNLTNVMNLRNEGFECLNHRFGMKGISQLAN
jgi:hypothetical protein